MPQLWWAYLLALRRRDWLAILLVIAVLGGSGALWSTGHLWQLWNFGFGPDWQCTYVGRGEPVCVKNTGKPTSH